MKLSKSESASTERRLIKYLTQACETAKGEIEGFVWLDHEVDYTNFPHSLMVSWAFDTREQRDQAANGPALERIHQLSEIALVDAGVPVVHIASHVRLARRDQV